MMVLFYGKKNANIDVFRELLNEIHPSLKFTVEKGKNTCEQNFDTFVQVLNILDVSIILHQNGRLETDIFYKETNSHDYLNYFSHLTILVTIQNTQSKTYQKDHRICI